MSFLFENVARGLSATANFQVGETVVDAGGNERGLLLPWIVSPAFSYLDRMDSLKCFLDNGMVVHRPLPDGAQNVDTLAGGDIFDTNYPDQTKGVNLKSAGRYEDVVQRMANSVYFFRLKGWARRVGYQVTIPSLLMIAGIRTVACKPPESIRPEFGNEDAENVIIGNLAGIPVWFARWELWYTLAKPPLRDQAPPPNFSEHITATDKVPDGIQVPITAPDPDAAPVAPRSAAGDNLVLPTAIRRSGPGTAGS